MKRLLLLILTILVLTTLSACGIDEPKPTGPVELWVVTERSPGYCMNTQTMKVIEKFEAEHENVAVRLDILPSDTEERSIYFDRLRTEILAGKGPDVYLLPVSNAVRERSHTSSDMVWKQVDMFFPDVAFAMGNGVFTDISSFYDADEELDKNGLQTSVMDAGVLNSARYVLPLRYNMPVLYADTQLLEESGISIDSISDIGSLMRTALETGDSKWIVSSIPDLAYEFLDTIEIGIDNDMDGINDEWQVVDAAHYNHPYRSIGLSYLGRCIDYEKQELLISQEDVAAFMKQYYQLTQTEAETFYHGYVYTGNALGLNGWTVSLDGLNRAMKYASYASALNRELTMIPLQSVSGEVIANVTYYAAVGAGCTDPGLAYQFIREFLSEECQWERTHELGEWHLLSVGWPVRAEGSVEALWPRYCPVLEDQYFYEPGQSQRFNEVIQVQLTQTDIPVLSAEVDGARFQISIEWYSLGRIITQLGDAEPGEYSDADIDAMPEEIISDLQWHLAEG